MFELIVLERFSSNSPRGLLAQRIPRVEFNRHTQLLFKACLYSYKLSLQLQYNIL